MKGKVKFAFLVMLAVFAAEAAYAAPAVKYVVENDQWQRQIGGKNVGEPFEVIPKQEDGLDMTMSGRFFNNSQETDAGTIYWLVVVWENLEEGAKKEEYGKEGVHFYDAKTKKYYFTSDVALPGGQTVYNDKVFSPNGKMFIGVGGDSKGIYSFPGLKRVSDFWGDWLDDERVVFEEQEPGLERPEYWSSVVIGNVAAGTKETLKKATPTSYFGVGIYSLDGITDDEDKVMSPDGKSIYVTEFYYDSAEDYENDENQQFTNHLVPIPAKK